MKIIIPMSGFGDRFRKAGYTLPKPLIEVEGKPIISHVVDMFPNEEEIIFICNKDHLAEARYGMRDTLFEICPNANIVGIDAHKLGPVHAVQQVQNLIEPSEQVVVNYCDFSCYWDWDDFKSFVNETECAGALPAYRGFHPHSLGTTNYAYIREQAGWVSDIQEKKPFTSDRMSEYASSGTYYFSSAELMYDAFARQIASGDHTNGEYYVSMAYRQLFKDDAQVAVYPLQHFMQWGTPGDVKEYGNWSTAFRELLVSLPPSNNPTGALIVPMAGMGSRFAVAGYETPKPLIDVSGAPMALQAIRDMPITTHHSFVLREDMPGKLELEKVLSSAYPDACIGSVPKLTEGQAITAKIGLETLQDHLTKIEGTVTISVCDSGCLYNYQHFSTAFDDPNTDMLVWGIRGYPSATKHPKQYGWLEVDNTGMVTGVSVKNPLSSPETDPIVLGVFTFKNAELARDLIARLIERDGRVNNEFYLDSTINDALATGKSVRLFEVSHFLCWGTPNDLKTFQYWQSCFHKWDSHPYKLEDDPRVSVEALDELKRKYAKISPKRPN